MRLFEIAQPALPATHPVMAIVEVDRDVWRPFVELISAVNGVRIAGHCPAPRGRVTVYLGCSDDKVRQVLESRWFPQDRVS